MWAIGTVPGFQRISPSGTPGALRQTKVLFYPALCIPDDARTGKMMYAKFDPQNLPERFTCGPMKLGRCYPADVIDMDPFQKIQSCDGPVLIVHAFE